MRRREGGREGEGIPRVWESTVAAEGMFGNLNPLGDGPGRGLADHGARVPEVLPAAELEGFLTGLTIAMPRKPAYRTQTAWLFFLLFFLLPLKARRTLVDSVCRALSRPSRHGALVVCCGAGRLDAGGPRVRLFERPCRDAAMRRIAAIPRPFAALRRIASSSHRRECGHTRVLEQVPSTRSRTAASAAEKALGTPPLAVHGRQSRSRGAWRRWSCLHVGPHSTEPELQDG